LKFEVEKASFNCFKTNLKDVEIRENRRKKLVNSKIITITKNATNMVIWRFSTIEFRDPKYGLKAFITWYYIREFQMRRKTEMFDGDFSEIERIVFLVKNEIHVWRLAFFDLGLMDFSLDKEFSEYYFNAILREILRKNSSNI
jgi:hypothetical protein